MVFLDHKEEENILKNKLFHCYIFLLKFFCINFSILNSSS